MNEVIQKAKRRLAAGANQEDTMPNTEVFKDAVLVEDETEMEPE